jgi:hypothetical protein
MRRNLLVTLLCATVNVAAALASHQAGAASPYFVDGVSLGASFDPRRGYQCSPSEQFPQYTWCERKRHERGRRGAFDSTTSILQDGAVAYVGREIRPAFFADDDMEGEIKRLSARFGNPSREMRLPDRDDGSNAIIALWGNITLEELDSGSRSALENAPASTQNLLVDYLGDIRRSLKLRLPIYRLRGKAGYLWSASSDEEGRGHLRFLAVDAAVLSGTKEEASRPGGKDPAAEAVKKRAAASAAKDVTGTVAKDANARSGRNTASAPSPTGDLRPFLTPQPTSSAPESGKQVGLLTKDRSQQTVIAKTRADAEQSRIVAAEQFADEERAKARVAWARFEAQRAAHENRVKWTLAASLIVLLATLALLRFMTRPQDLSRVQEVLRKLTQALPFLSRALHPVWEQVKNLFRLARIRVANLMMKAHSAIAPKPGEPTEQTG